MPVSALLAAAPGLIKAGASLFGGGKRRRAEQEAQAKFAQQQEALENFQFQNPYKNLENTAEDLTVNQQAAQFEAQQADASLANIADQAAQSGGPVDWTALAGQGLQQKQQSSASIAQQEAANQAAAARQAAANQSAEAGGEATLQTQRHGQIQQQFNLAQQQLSDAQAARQQARADLVGGIADSVGAVAGGIADGTVKNPFKRLQSLYSDGPMKRTEGEENGEPKKRTYGGDRFERKELLNKFLKEGGHAFSDLGGGRYTVGGQQVTIDPTTGGFKGHGAKRAEEFFARRAQHSYDKDYTKALKAAGLQAGFDERQGGGGARGAVIQGAIDAGGDVNQITGAQQRYREGAGDVQALEYADDANRLEATAPLNRMKKPLYRIFKMKWKGM